jgi:hypothetical protein
MLAPAGIGMLVHVFPPSLLAQTAAVPRSIEDPPTTQSVKFEQEMASISDDPAGIVTDVHVAPPSSVMISYAPSLAFTKPAGFAPIATHTVADEQETDRRTPVPSSTNLGDQVCPPSLLTRI